MSREEAQQFLNALTSGTGGDVMNSLSQIRSSDHASLMDLYSTLTHHTALRAGKSEKEAAKITDKLLFGT